jgi:NADP-dependent 3-hydroxy acid dehydrogenase YdfG
MQSGTSTGLGHALAQHIIDNGDKVAATGRNASRLKFDNATNENFLPVQLDVTSLKSIDSAFEAILKKFGRVDVVVCVLSSSSSAPRLTPRQEQRRLRYRRSLRELL